MKPRFWICLVCLLMIASVHASATTLIDLQAIDHSVQSCENFYQYACGNWINDTRLLADQSIMDRGFIAALPAKINSKLQAVLQSYAKGNAMLDVPYAKQLGNFYASCMNQSLINKNAPAALAKQLALIDQIHTTADIPAAVALLQLKQINVLFNFDSGADFLNPKLQMGQLTQGGMGLPDSTYYTSTASANLATLKRYQAYGAQLFERSGASPKEAIANMQIVLAIETTLAKGALPPQDLHNLAQLYHPMSLVQLQAQSKHFNWSAYFSALGISAPKIINVTEPRFLSTVNSVLQQFSLPDLKIYFKWQILKALAPYLSTPYVNAAFAFEQHYLDGQKTMAPRAAICEHVISNSMGNALGHAYVAKYFNFHSKEMVQDMMNTIMQAFATELKQAAWMDDQTRAAALEKLSKIKIRIGYPDTWRSYEGLSISRSSFLDNVLNAAIYTSKQDLAKIGQKTDPDAWRENPQIVDASYIPTVNSIEVLAGILQPPYFSKNAPLAQNYGGIGMVMAHELIHGFDTSGRNFDANGVMRDWWSKATEKKYLQNVQCLEAQYSGYTVFPGVRVNGTLTITENIADQGGIKLAYAALKMAAPTFQQTVDGFTEDQQYFLTFGQAFCAKAKAAYYRDWVNQNPHAPPEVRVNGILMNDVNFAPVFHCPAHCAMSPIKRCQVW